MPKPMLCFAQEDVHCRCSAAIQRRPYAWRFLRTHKRAPAGPTPSGLILGTANSRCTAQRFAAPAVLLVGGERGEKHSGLGPR